MLRKVGGEKMEKGRSSKVVAVVALVVAVFGLTLGFAAFSNTLVISSSANVKPDASAFSVVFSNDESSVVEGGVQATTYDDGATGDAATLDATTVTGIKANFTKPGQKVTYTFYAHNTGSYIAYLRSISYKNISESVQQHKVCTVTDQEIDENEATDSLVQAACEGISISVAVGSETATGTTTVTGHSLALSAHETVVVTVEYGSTASPADGEFDVTFGDIELLYSSVDGE